MLRPAGPLVLFDQPEDFRLLFIASELLLRGSPASGR